MAYHEIVHNETRKGARGVLGLPVLVYCIAALLGLAHFQHKYAPFHPAPAEPLAAPLSWSGQPADPNATISAAPAAESSWVDLTCPTGHFCAYPVGNESLLVDCTADEGRGVSPCYLWITEVGLYGFRMPVLSCVFPLLPAALALLCQVCGTGAGEIMLQPRTVAVKALRRVATYVMSMIVFHVWYVVKADLERELLGDFDASDTVAAYMLATTIAWREYAHVAKARGSDCTTYLVFCVCVAQLACAMYVIYNTCQYFHRPWESVGGMLQGLFLCYILFYVTTADSGFFVCFAGTRDAPFNSPGLCNMPKREAFIPKDARRKQRPAPAADAPVDGPVQEP